eukprot:6178530-Pleurochrysis_carterae.AAC.1
MQPTFSSSELQTPRPPYFCPAKILLLLLMSPIRHVKAISRGLGTMRMGPRSPYSQLRQRGRVTPGLLTFLDE